MADLSTLFPNSGGGPFPDVAGGYLDGQQAQIAQQNARLNQQGYLQNLYQQQQLNPIKVQQEQENLKSTQLANKKSIFEQDQAERLAEPTYKAKLAELTANTSANEVKASHAKIESLLMSPDPSIREEAKKLYMMTSDMLKLMEPKKLEGENQMKVQKLKSDTDIRVANIGADATKSAATTRAEAVGKNKVSGVWGELAAARGKPVESYNIMLRYYNDPNTSEEDKQRLLAMSPDAAQFADAANKARFNPYVVDPATGKLGANPNQPAITVPPAPGVSDRPDRQNKTYSIQQLKALYPGRTEEELRKAATAKGFTVQ